uniref:Uncharacterized protein n=1 Tax=Rhizophora mucronata TaxID=61149 RepID=A0A2P2PVY6_RHIMU
MHILCNLFSCCLCSNIVFVLSLVMSLDFVLLAAIELR